MTTRQRAPHSRWPWPLVSSAGVRRVFRACPSCQRQKMDCRCRLYVVPRGSPYGCRALAARPPQPIGAETPRSEAAEWGEQMGGSRTTTFHEKNDAIVDAACRCGGRAVLQRVRTASRAAANTRSQYRTMPCSSESRRRPRMCRRGVGGSGGGARGGSAVQEEKGRVQAVSAQGQSR